MFGQAIEASGLDEPNADKPLAQQALDSAVMYTDGLTANPDKIVIAVDIDPLEAFSNLGLTIVEEQVLDTITE